MRRELEQAVVALSEGHREAPVALGQVARQPALHAAEDGLALRVGSDQDQGVVRQADEGGRQHGEQRLVVVAVLQQPEVGEEVDDLLLAEVVPPGGAIRRQTDGSELFLEPFRVRACREEQHDLAGCCIAGVDELADALGDVPRLRAPPVDACLRCRALVRDEQLERVPKRRHRSSAGSSDWNSSPNSAPKSSFTAARTSGRDRWFSVRGSTICAHGAALAEHGDVRVPEAVDRLELVADDEEIRRPPSAESRSRSSVWRRFVSWNSSTMIERNRCRSRSRIAAVVTQQVARA